VVAKRGGQHVAVTVAEGQVEVGRKGVRAEEDTKALNKRCQFNKSSNSIPDLQSPRG